MILEEDIEKVDEDIAIDWYWDYSFYIMKRKEQWKLILCSFVSHNSISLELALLE